MLDFNDFQPMGDSSNPVPSQQESNQLDINQMNDFLSNTNNPQIDEEEQKRISDRQKEAEERKEKINKKMKEEEEARIEIRKKAAEYLTEFEEKEANPSQGNNSNGTADSWSKVSGNIDLKDSEYKGSKDVQRMREAMMHRQNDPNSEPLQKFFG